MFLVKDKIWGAYAAVIPKWVASMLKHDEIYIYGDGRQVEIFVM